MLQPKVEARILQELAPRKHETALEVGTGSGYFAALLAARSQRVSTVELDPELKAFGEGNLRRAGVSNVRAELGDAAQGWGAHAPYDVILTAAGGPDIPQPLLAQLKTGGRLVIPIGATRESQRLIRVIRTEDGYAMIISGDPQLILSSDKNLDVTDRVVARLKTIAATPTKVGAPVSAPAGVTRKPQ